MNPNVTINGDDIATVYNAKITLDGWVVGGTPVDNHYYQGANRTNWTMIKSYFGLRPIKMTVIITNTTLNLCFSKKSFFDYAMFGKFEMYAPDGYYYTCMCSSFGEAEIIGIGDADSVGQQQLTAIKATYELEAVRHGALVTTQVSSGTPTIFCSSSMPKTDCRISCTVIDSASSYNFAGATWANVRSGERLVFDGITGRVLRNNVANAANVTFTQFPQLNPGFNNLVCPDGCTVEYYPAFM